MGLIALKAAIALLRRAEGATNNGAVQRNPSGAVAWKERVPDPTTAVGRRRIGRVRDNIGIDGDKVMVRRLGCIVGSEMDI